MAIKELNEDMPLVELDGQQVDYQSLEVGYTPEKSKRTSLCIKLQLNNGEVIHDDGSRVTVIWSIK